MYVLQGYKVTRLQGFMLTRLHGYKVTRLQGYMLTRLQGYKVTQLHGYKVTRLHSYKATRLQGYRVTRLQGYKVTKSVKNSLRVYRDLLYTKIFEMRKSLKLQINSLQFSLEQKMLSFVNLKKYFNQNMFSFALQI